MCMSAQLQTVLYKFSFLLRRYLETCHLLGLHYVLERDPLQHRLAAAYFRMSGRPAVACLHASLEEHFRGGGGGEAGGLPPGIVSYVEEIVLRPAVPSENVLDAGLADAVIDLLGRHSTGTLAALVLRSRAFREFKTRKTRKFLAEAVAATATYAEEGDPIPAELALSLSLLSLDEASEREDARLLLLRMWPSSVASLAGVLIEHHHLLFDRQGAAFSDLATFLQDSLPDVFVEV